MVGTFVRAKFRRHTTQRLGGDRPQTKYGPELLQHGKNGKSYQECCVTEECPLVLKEKCIEQW